MTIRWTLKSAALSWNQVILVNAVLTQCHAILALNCGTDARWSHSILAWRLEQVKIVFVKKLLKKEWPE